MKCIQTVNVFGYPLLDLVGTPMNCGDSAANTVFHDTQGLNTNCDRHPKQCRHHTPVLVEDDADEFLCFAMLTRVNAGVGCE